VPRLAAALAACAQLSSLGRWSECCGVCPVAVYMGQYYWTFVSCCVSCRFICWN
jgi:hypothetical protein